MQPAMPQANAYGQMGPNLDNQSIAAANAYGQMANNYYNLMGQMGQYGTSLAASGMNTNASQAQARYSDGGSGGGGGYGGFNVSGPAGNVASGALAGLYGGGGGGGGMSMSVSKGAPYSQTKAFANQGFNFLGGLVNRVHSNNSDARIFAGMLGNEFKANREAAFPNPYQQAQSNVAASRLLDKYKKFG